ADTELAQLNCLDQIDRFRFSTVKTDPGGLPSAREITLMESPVRHRRHKSSFIASDIPGRPIRATIHPSTSSVALIV
ncbi:hypothetical protein, partial [Streptosporangium lutulentum]|uniref:hypothetical protein n=1 Tax=Streptosporangium lutulentum TaxID=1461250 RepID=UPI00362C2DF2